MSETSANPGQNPESQSAIELLHSTSALAADVLLRSGLPLDAKWTKISFVENTKDGAFTGYSEQLEIESLYGYSIRYTRTDRDLVQHLRIGESHATVDLDSNGVLAGHSGDVSIDDLSDKLSAFQGCSARVEFDVPAAG